MNHMRPALVAATTLFLWACGGGFAAGKPWNADLEAGIFDDGVDLVDDPAKLSGEWETSARRALEVRASAADLTAIVHIASMQTTKDVDGTEARRITVDVRELLYGRAPNESIVLESAATALGNALIVRHESRLTGSFVAFVRWFDRGDGSLGSHFHFSPSSKEVLDLVRAQTAKRIEKELAPEK